MTRPDWLAERRLGIGGSDVAGLFNVGYGCKRRCWYDKRSIPEDFPRQENLAMKLGHVLEPFFATQYFDITQRSVRVLDKAIVHPIIPELRVNIDRAVTRGGVEGVLEIKSVGRAMFFKIKREGLPVDYILQLQHGMLVSGMPFGAFAIGSRDSGELLHWDVEAEASIQASILEAGPKFWSRVENGPIPDALEPDDRRCQECSWRTTCQGNALVQLAPASDYEADESLAPLVREYVDRRALVKEADGLMEEVKAELQCKLGERTMVTAGGAKIQFYSSPRKEYTVKASVIRALRVYEGWK